VSAPRLEVDLGAVGHNARHLVTALGARGIRVVGITKSVLAWANVARALLDAGVVGLGDSRVENLAALRHRGFDAPLTLVRSPMPSQVDGVVRNADVSLNTEDTVLRALAAAATRQATTHGVVVMVELGDLREGVAMVDVVAMARSIGQLPGLVLTGIGTNLACQSGVVPDQRKMDELSGLADEVEVACHVELAVVSGGNSASLAWALSTPDVGRIDELRLGESVLLGVDPLDRRPIEGLRQDGFRLVAEVIEVKTKPAAPWGAVGQTAFGAVPVPGAAEGASGGGRAGMQRRAILALGRQDVDPDGLVPPAGLAVLGASSDHLVIDVGDHDLAVGDEVGFGVGYAALLRAATSPFVAKVESPGSTGVVGTARPSPMARALPVR
jgi:predicted amino acid racemase